MSNGKQQTAVEWYDNEIEKLLIQFGFGAIYYEEFKIKQLKLKEQAKEMEKEQMIKTALFWSHSTVTHQNVIDYIDETYGGNK
jgi:hypothetical protein